MRDDAYKFRFHPRCIGKALERQDNRVSYHKEKRRHDRYGYNHYRRVIGKTACEYCCPKHRNNDNHADDHKKKRGARKNRDAVLAALLDNIKFFYKSLDPVVHPSISI